MGAELPAELAEIATLTGVTWPEADEDALREQARAWRTAEDRLSALAGEAEVAARVALDGLSGSVAEAARLLWNGFADPAEGRLAAAARGAGQAAERLEHAAEQVGTAKVEIVRRLVEAAKDRDATRCLAEAGQPAALLGLDAAARATATNLGALGHGLANAVSSAAVTPVAELSPVVDAHPHVERGEHELFAAVTGMPVTVLDAALAEVRDERLVVTPADVPPESEVDLDTGPITLGLDGEPPTVPTGHSLGLPDQHPSASLRSVPPGSTVGAAVPRQERTPGGQAVPVAAGKYRSAGGSNAVLPSSGAPSVPMARGALTAPADTGAARSDSAPPFSAGSAATGPLSTSPPSPHRPATEPPPSSPGCPPIGSPRQDPESIAALFRVYMFPIGHLPVPTDHPSRQLPAPEPENDYAAGLRFPPHDHPRSDVIDPGRLLTRLRQRRGEPRPAPEPASAPEALTEGHDPLGALSQREWDRRFLAHSGGSAPEYAWPPGERYPEGGCAPGVPVLLGKGTMLDRFGTPYGRVFAPHGTAFAARALPPSHLDAGYHCYRVVREVPMWHTRSAPWFGQPGGGNRYRALYSAAELVALGYLVGVPPESPSAEEAAT
jgi:hypothetical protein